MTKASEAVGAPIEITHPEWCYPSWCMVQPLKLSTGETVPNGDHLRPVRSMTKCEGGDLHVALTHDTTGEQMYVTLYHPLHTDWLLPDGLPDTPVSRRRAGDSFNLEPEEARMLARFLIAAADEWERVNGTK